jgi:hypothetical protein
MLAMIKSAISYFSTCVARTITKVIKPSTNSNTDFDTYQKVLFDQLIAFINGSQYFYLTDCFYREVVSAKTHHKRMQILDELYEDIIDDGLSFECHIDEESCNHLIYFLEILRLTENTNISKLDEVMYQKVLTDFKELI